MDQHRGIAGRIDRVTGAIGQAAAWLALFIVVVQFAVVLLRYALGVGSIWMSESILYANAALFMLAAAWTLRDNAHVRVDIFYTSASARTKAWIDLCGTVFLLFPFMAVLAYFALPYVLRSFATGEGSREASGLPALYLVKALIPFFALLMTLQGIAQLLRACDTLRKTELR